MPIIDSAVTVNLTAGVLSGGQSLDFSGYVGSVAYLINDQAGVPIQYSTNNGSSWTTLAAGASVSLIPTNPSQVRLRKNSDDNFPIPVSVDFDFGTAAEANSGGIRSITYANGQPTLVIGDGWSGSATYDAQGRLLTYTENGITRTATYNVDGTLASYL